MKKSLFILLWVLTALLSPSLLKSHTNECSLSKSGDEGIDMYAYKSLPNNSKGWVKFNSSDPSVITSIAQDETYAVSGGAYVDTEFDGTGVTYLFRTKDGASADFVKINIQTGETTFIADYSGIDNSYVDMSYDYSTSTMYALEPVTRDGKRASDLITINLIDGVYATVANLDRVICALAVDMSGQMWGIDSSGYLLKINKSTGDITEVGSTGISNVANNQSMAFDHTNNELYWASIWSKGRALCHVNTSTGIATNIGTAGITTMLNALTIPFTYIPNTPTSVTDFTITPGENGALSANLSWTNPTKFKDGSNATIASVKVYRNNELVKTISSPGATSSWMDTDIPQSTFYTYKIIATSEAGDGYPISQKVFVGRDVPMAPSEVTLTGGEGLMGIITWSAPSDGVNGGWIDLSSLSYNIARISGSSEMEIATGITALTYTDETITAAGNYKYKVTAITADGTGGDAVSNEILMHNPYDVPYYMGFNSDEDYAIWQTTKWKWKSFGGIDSSGNMEVTTSTKGDYWLFSPKIKLEEDKSYKIVFYTKSGIYSPPNYADKLSVSVASDLSEDAVIEEVWSNEEILNKWIKQEFTISGYEGFYSLAFKSFGRGFNLNIDDFSIIEQKPTDVGIVSISGPKETRVNKEFTFKVNVKNEGETLISAYTINLLDNEDNVLETYNFTDELAPATSASIQLLYTPTIVGSTEFRAQIVVEDDENNENDISSSISFNVQSEDEIFKSVVGEMDTFRSYNMPFNFYRRSSFTQYILFDSEIGVSGKIDSIVYYTNFADEVIDKPVKIWMANTDVAILDNWVPKSEFTLVFDGNISIAAGTLETLVIKLSNPFLSDGRNIVVMTERPMDSQSFGMNSFFYETRSDIVNRSRFYASDKDSFDDTQEGEPTNRHPNMSLYMIIDGGTLSGTVTDGTDPIPGVTIEVLNENLHAITNENGVFEFVFMPVGNFELKAGKLGYEDIVKNATISLDNNTVVDFELSLRPVYNISGTITRDKTTIPLEGAVVTLKGDSNYEATSGTDGKYEIQNVYSGYTYDVEISKYGYTSQIATLSVNENVTDYDFSLDELLYPVNLVEGKVNASGEMEITWYNPTSSFPKDFRYDNGIAVGKMSISNGNSNSILGAVHKAKSQINEISWMTNDTDFNPPAKVNVFILDLDENGMPTQTLLYSAVDLDNENQQWMTHILPNSIEAPNGFMLGISCNDGNICLGVSKPDDDYPFNKNVQFLSADYTTGDFTVVETLPGAGNYNLMIRAKGYQMGEQFLEKGLENNMPLYTCTSLANYSVYRLIKGEDEADWTLLSNAVNDTIYTDKDWANLDCNLYQYAVQANYTNASSSFRLSAPLNDCFSIEFNIVDEEDSIIEGATITFNGDELSSYLSEPVKPGEYNYSVVKEAYKTYEGKVIVTDSNITEKVTLTKAVGLEQYSLSEVQVYPNPFKDEIFVSNPEMVNKLIVFDITGQKVKEMPLTGNSASLSELTDGVYFIVIENLIGNRATYKLVKQ